jgi:hypothetical protein
LAGLFASGCPFAAVLPEPTDGNDGVVVVIDGNRDPSLISPLGKTSGEPNDIFGQTVVAVFDAQGIAELQGTVESTDDIDVFLLGALNPGDRVVIDAYDANSGLDITAVMFDAEERLVAENDDREDGSGSLDALIDFVVRHGGEEYYLAVSHAAFASSSRRVGEYYVDIAKEAGVAVPAPVAQALFLDFDGAVVTSPVLVASPPVRLTAFDSADISAIYDGQTQTIKDRIREVFDENYAPFDVTIVTSDDPPLPEGTSLSTIYFGGFDRSAFGIAEDVDLYNVHRCDDAIIFTETFGPAAFSETPSAGEVGTAIGNVACHEAGHLLGLNHTDDDMDLMDDQSPADAFLQDQEFTVAPLSDDILPLGRQDAVLLLNETVGPRP